MKIGMITDSLPDTTFEAMLSVASRLGMEMLEFGCGNWSNAPHLDLDRMLASDVARREFRSRLTGHGIAISALNCSGNPLHPGEPGRKHDEVTRKTIRLAGLMGVERVVMMSGCPGAPGDSHANWITTEWPPEVREIVRWQWDEVLIPYWRDLVAFANAHGIRKLCLELHGYQNVYNVATLKRLRDAVGETVGANLDPSHLMWMGADPIASARALGDAIHHCHGKDTRIERGLADINGLLELKDVTDVANRTWNYVAVGAGHDLQWWKEFFSVVRMVGYNDWVSLEMEDFTMSTEAGIQSSIDALQATISR